MKVYQRDASWHPYANGRGNYATRYHRMSDKDIVAACSRRIVINDDEGVMDHKEVPRVLLCKRCFPNTKRKS